VYKRQLRRTACPALSGIFVHLLRWIFDGAAVAAARKSNAADGKIDKEVWLKVNVSVYWCSFVFVENLRNLKNFPPFF
jgi:hypothetical protein